MTGCASRNKQIVCGLISLAVCLAHSYYESGDINKVIGALFALIALATCDHQDKGYINMNYWTLLAVGLLPQASTFFLIGWRVISNDAERTLKRGIKSHSAEGLLEMYAYMFKPYCELVYVGKPDFSLKPFDEYSVMNNANEFADWYNKSVVFRRVAYVASLFVATAFLTDVKIALIVTGTVFVITTKTNIVKSDGPTYRTSGPMKMEDGLYKVTTSVMGVDHHIGIGYMDQGTFYTRYHVTNGRAICTRDGMVYEPAYSNPTNDNIAYGDIAKWTPLVEGEEVLVALAGPYSQDILLYKTQATSLSDGTMVFTATKSIPGCSGSPIFKEVSFEVTDKEGNTREVKEYKIVGSVGWAAEIETRSEKTNYELLKPERDVDAFDTPVHIGQVTQLFKHPGAGKTTREMPDLVVKGLNMFGRVYVTGPTKVVCAAIHAALASKFEGQVSLMTSSATNLQRGSSIRPIVVAAHATMLNMLSKGSPTTAMKGLWIMDEAHFVNTKSICLKVRLRHMVKHLNKGSLVEMTATGFNFRSKELINMNASNHHIEEINKDNDGILLDLFENARSKSVVFVTAIKGKNKTTAASIARELTARGIPHVELTRETFDANYEKAQEMKEGVILTTDISECGANFSADNVYDFQISSKPVNHGLMTVYEPRAIDQGQRTQRRGRCGRDRPGRYISPCLTLQDMDSDRVEYKEAYAYSKVMGYDYDDIRPHDELKNFNLTVKQIQMWMDISSQSVESSWMIQLMVDPEGYPLTAAQRHEKMMQWAEGDEAATTVATPSGKVTLTCAFWDDRDRPLFEALAYKSGKLGVGPRVDQTTLLEKTVSYLSKLRGTIRSDPAAIPPDGQDTGPPEGEVQQMPIV